MSIATELAFAAWDRFKAEVLAEPEPISPEPDGPRPIVGDPTLGGDGIRIAIDADCPGCGWPERWFDTLTRHFGCVKCSYTSDERNA